MKTKFIFLLSIISQVALAQMLPYNKSASKDFYQNQSNAPAYQQRTIQTNSDIPKIKVERGKVNIYNPYSSSVSVFLFYNHRRQKTVYTVPAKDYISVVSKSDYAYLIICNKAKKELGTGTLEKNSNYDLIWSESQNCYYLKKSDYLIFN